MTNVAAHTLRLTPSQRARNVEPSGTLALDAKARELRAQGKPIISFSLGEPDFATPEPIKAAADRAMAANATHYTTVGGEQALRQAIAARTAESSGVPFTDKQVLATTGAKEALYIIFQALCDPGDEVILPMPYWVSYAEQIKMAGAQPVIVQTDPANWRLTPDALKQHLTPRTRAVVLCTPSNPTGIVYSDSELRGLADVLRGTSVAMVVDEIYARISYVPVGRWLRAAPDLADQSLIVDGVSKSYAMTGWRLGWVAGPEALIAAANGIQSHLTSHPSSLAQRAALYALGNDAAIEAEVDQMVHTFHQRRDAIVAGLSAIPGLRCPTPEGAFYAFPDVRGLLNKPLGTDGTVCRTSAELATYLLDRALVSIPPGEAFGAPGYLRLSYALGMEELQAGVARMAEALAFA